MATPCIQVFIASSRATLSLSRLYIQVFTNSKERYSQPTTKQIQQGTAKCSRERSKTDSVLIDGKDSVEALHDAGEAVSSASPLYERRDYSRVTKEPDVASKTEVFTTKRGLTHAVLDFAQVEPA